MIARLFLLSLSAVVLLAIATPLALTSAAPALAGHAPATSPPSPPPAAAEATLDPTNPRPAAQEGEEQQFAERNTDSDNEWIVIGVVLMIVFTVLGFALAAFGLSSE